MIITITEITGYRLSDTPSPRNHAISKIPNTWDITVYYTVSELSAQEASTTGYYDFDEAYTRIYERMKKQWPGSKIDTGNGHFYAPIAHRGAQCYVLYFTGDEQEAEFILENKLLEGEIL